MAKRISEANIPAFTVDSDGCQDLHKLGIPGFNRKTVKTFLEDKGAKPAIPQDKIRKPVEAYEKPTSQQLSFIKEPTQMELGFKKNGKDGSS